MKQFDIPTFYRSGIITGLKRKRSAADRMKKDLSPTVFDCGPVRFIMPRHFGFCYGVENAIEISYRALEENEGKRIFLLSQMIHNPVVNADLEDRGIQFIMDTEGNQFIPWDEVKVEDVVIIPAFGTTLEIEKLLEDKGVEVQKYNTTCPFVEKVWKRSAKLGQDGHTIIIHGKHSHEETRATFSHATSSGASMVLKNLDEAHFVGQFILGQIEEDEFRSKFEGRMSDGFEPTRDLDKIGVVNQTTMLATETQAIADHLKTVMEDKYGGESKAHFADTRDTLCYATNDNQSATISVLDKPADLALVVGGYNSSNTSHIVELCEEKLPTYFINLEKAILSEDEIEHFDWRKKERLTTSGWLPASKAPLDIIVTSGASCPDALVEEVIQKVLSYFPDASSLEEAAGAYD